MTNATNSVGIDVSKTLLDVLLRYSGERDTPSLTRQELILSSRACAAWRPH